MMHTPNEVREAGIRLQLDNKEPETHEDQQLLMNFFAANVHPDCAKDCCLLMNVLYDMGLTETEVQEIVDFQLERVS